MGPGGAANVVTNRNRYLETVLQAMVDLILFHLFVGMEC